MDRAPRRVAVLLGIVTLLTLPTPAVAEPGAPPTEPPGAPRTETVLTAFDAPPSLGGRPVISTTLPDRTRPPTDPDKALRNIKGPPATLFHGERTAEPTALSSSDAVNSDSFTLENCYANPQSQQSSGWVPDHLHFCQVTYFTIENRTCTGSNCTITGTVNWRSGTIGRGTSGGGRSVNFVNVFDQWIVTGDGANNSLTLAMQCTVALGTGGCNTNPLYPNTYTQTIPQWISQGVGAYFEFNSSSAGAYGPDLITLSDFQTTATLVGANSVALGPNTFRCDSATYIQNAGGCVFPQVQELFKLSRSDPAVDESANHIFDAQFRPFLTVPAKPNKQVPGSVQSGRPLNRIFYNTALRDSNRSTAVATCQMFFPGYAALGLQCDEYSFASTLQGAASGNDYSARALGAADNQMAGTRLSAFYRDQRILDEIDYFYVVILA